MIINSHVTVQIVAAIIWCTQDLVSWKQEKEVLTVKHWNNIPCYEARKLVVGSKTTTYSQAVQPNKSPYNKYETIVKTFVAEPISTSTPQMI